MQNETDVAQFLNAYKYQADENQLILIGLVAIKHKLVHCK